MSRLKTDKLNKPLLIYDGTCGFCKIWIRYWQQITGDQLDYAPYQEAASEFPDIPIENFKSAVQLVQPNGEVKSAAHAVFQSLAYAPNKSWPLWLYKNVWGFKPITEWGYRIVASHRSLFFHATRFLFGKHIEPVKFSLVNWTFTRLLCLTYFIAFFSFALQIDGLVGSNGILPAEQFFERVQQSVGAKGYWLAPSLFWFCTSDFFLNFISYGGAVLALVALIGFAQRAMLIVLFTSYLSLVSVGQTFMSFQWDALLLEVGFLSLFIGSTTVVWLFRFLLFKLMFFSGAVKLLSGDAAWGDLTALNFHYETQPLPHFISWYAHQLPEWFQAVSTFLMFVIELAFPFLMLAPRRLRFVAAIATVFLQVLIVLTGNYNFFNLLTIALCIFLFDDALLRGVIPQRLTERVSNYSSIIHRSTLKRMAVAILAVFIISLNSLQMMRSFRVELPQPAIDYLNWFAPLHIVNGYGLFSVMTTKRPEIIVEGSYDHRNWQAYEFKYKPGDLSTMPRWAMPHQPRLDWQMWFAALGNYQRNPWLVNFTVRLLEGSPEVIALLKENPFPDAPPKYIRATLYEYKFTNFEKRAFNGNWWQREYVSSYMPAISLRKEN